MAVTTPGNDDQFSTPPPDPVQTPTGSSVDHPRFGDGSTDEDAADSRRGLIAPIVAGLVLIGGVGLLTVAALLERSERPILPTRPTFGADTDRVESLTEAFTRRFD